MIGNPFCSRSPPTQPLFRSLFSLPFCLSHSLQSICQRITSPLLLRYEPSTFARRSFPPFSLNIRAATSRWHLLPVWFYQQLLDVASFGSVISWSLPCRCQNQRLLHFVSSSSFNSICFRQSHPLGSLLTILRTLFPLRSQLGASGNLQSTTKPATREKREVVNFNMTGPTRVWAAMSPAEQRAAANDEDLESYFQAFPEQAPSRVNRLVSLFAFRTHVRDQHSSR